MGIIFSKGVFILNPIKKAIEATLRTYLHNSQLQLVIQVSEKQQIKVLSRREQLEEMIQQNPAVEMLRKAFDLELA